MNFGSRKFLKLILSEPPLLRDVYKIIKIVNNFTLSLMSRAVWDYETELKATYNSKASLWPPLSYNIKP